MNRIEIGHENATIAITKTPEFTEVWYSGYVEFRGERHDFWLVDPQGTDSRGNQYEVDVRWFFKNIPADVRKMESQIKQHYLEQHDKRVS